MNDEARQPTSAEPGPHWGDGPLRRRRPGPPPRRAARTDLVIGWDRRPASMAAMRMAVGLGHELDAHVHVVHIVDLSDTPLDPDDPDWETRFAETVDEEALAARRLLDELPASWTYHSGHGSAATLLATVADRYHALMVVIGGQRGGVMSYLDSVMGQSVTQRMIGQRKVPLLIVPADTELPPWLPADGRIT